MVFFNWATMQMAAKIVYYGPGLCGKTSNLSYIYAKTAPGSRGEMVSLETESDRTLFFDLLPIEVGTIGGFKTRLQLYTVPGQVFYNTTRKLVLKGVDGLVFVADSQRPMRDANMESFATLKDNLKEFGLSLSDLPIVLQYNKRDLSNILSVDELNADLNPEREFLFCEASAVSGDGVITTLKEITKLTLKKLRTRMNASDAKTEGGVRVAAPSLRGVKSPQPASPISARSLVRAAEEGVGDPPPPDARQTAAKTPQAAAAARDATTEPAQEPPVPPVEKAPKQVSEPAVEWSSPNQEPSPFLEEPVIPDDEEEPMKVGFENGSTGDIEAPPLVKRVHVSNQIDILAELDSLRKQATMRSRDRDFSNSSPDLDLDSLLSAATPQTREARKKLERSVNSDIFKRMRGVQFAIRIQDEDGETIHTFDPVSLEVDDATGLKRLCLHLSLDLENLR
jgi:signal recognition particle receptor subunit beta